MSHWSKKECSAIIEKYKNDTAYFGNTLSGNPLSFENMYDMLRGRMGFGMAEAILFLLVSSSVELKLHKGKR